MNLKEQATSLVLHHNNLAQTVLIVTSLLEGSKNQSEIAKEFDVSVQWVYKINRKYVKPSKTKQ